MTINISNTFRVDFRFEYLEPEEVVDALVCFARGIVGLDAFLNLVFECIAQPSGIQVQTPKSNGAGRLCSDTHAQ